MSEVIQVTVEHLRTTAYEGLLLTPQLQSHPGERVGVRLVSGYCNTVNITKAVVGTTFFDEWDIELDFNHFNTF